MAAPSLARTEAQCAMAAKLARRLRESRHELATAWVDAIVAHDSSQPPRPPSSEMVDDMPLLIDGIAWHLEHPDERLGVDSPVIRKAMQIGTLRHAQGFTTRDILEEYELLGHVLFDCLSGVVEEGDVDGNPMLCGSLLFHAIVVIEITTTTHYLGLAAKRVAEREERLHAFNRAVSHEIKNQLSTIANAGQMLIEAPELSRDEMQRFADIITRNAHAMHATVNNLLVLARVEDDPDEHPRVPLRRAVANVVEQIAPVAQAAHVDLRVDEQLPDVEVDDAVVELSLANYVRNAITYADNEVSRRVVAIHACVEQHEGSEPELVVNVADNGLGVPVEKRAHLFERFFRAHESTHKDGTGLGLSIVQASVKAIGGRAWAEFPEKGSRFSFAVPLRRRPSRRKSAGGRRVGSAPNIGL